MATINTNKEIIKLYARQLKTPTFSNYDEIIRQLQSDDGYEEFLKEIMRTELLQRQDNLHKRKELRPQSFRFIRRLMSLI